MIGAIVVAILCLPAFMAGVLLGLNRKDKELIGYCKQYKKESEFWQARYEALRDAETPTLESVPLEKATTERVCAILKERGFSQYQD